MSQKQADYKTAKPYYRNPRHITKSRLERLDKNLVKYGDLGGIVHNVRTNQIIGGNQRTAVARSHEHEVVIKETFDPALDDGTVAKGEIRIAATDKESGKKRNVFLSYRQVDWDEETESGANLAANVNAGAWDLDIAASQWSANELIDFAGWDDDLLETEKKFTKALDTFLKNEKAEPEIEEITESIAPKEMARVLVSVPIDKALAAKEILDSLLEIEGIEVVYGAN